MSRWHGFWQADKKNEIASWQALTNNEWMKIMRQYKPGMVRGI